MPTYGEIESRIIKISSEPSELTCIASKIAAHFGVTLADLKKKKGSRKRELSDIRHHIIYYIHTNYPEFIWKELAEVTGNKNHATAINSYKRIKGFFEVGSSTHANTQWAIACLFIKQDYKLLPEKI